MIKMAWTKNQRDNSPLHRTAMCLVMLVVAGLIFTLGINRTSYGAVQGLDKLNQFLQKTSNSSDPAIKLLREGRDAIDDNDWRRAAERFNDFITDYPKHKDVDQALYWLGYSLAKLEKYKEANEKLQRLVNEFPKSSWKHEADMKIVEIAPK